MTGRDLRSRRRAVEWAGTVAIFLLLLPGTGAAQAPPPAPELVASMEEAVREATGDVLVGAGFCFYLDGAPLIEGGYGWARAPYEETSPALAMGPRTVVPLASTSKPVNAAALLLALDRRGLGPDARVVDLLPAGYAEYGPHVEGMTVAHLLSHTSGFDFRDIYLSDPPIEPAVRALLEGGAERAPGGDPAEGLWTAGQGPPPEGWAGAVYSNVNYFVVRILTEKLTGVAFEDAVRALVLDPAGLDWHADAEPEPRTLGYSRWNPGGPGRRSPDSFRGHAGPAGWHSSACGLAQGAWSLFHGGLLPVRLRDAMRTEELGIFARDEGGLPIWLHSGVWTPGGGQGFELGLADLPGGVTGGFATNTWGNFRGAEVVRTLWRSHTPRVEVRPREGRDGPDGRVDREGTGSRAVTVALHYDAVPGAVLRWTTDPALPLSSGSTYRGPFVLPSVGTVRVAAFLDGRLASLPVTVPLGGVAQAPVPERPPARPTSSPRSDGSR